MLPKRCFTLVIALLVCTARGQMAPAASPIAGRVLLPDGTPAADAELVLLALQAGPSGVAVTLDATFAADADGRFSRPAPSEATTRKAMAILVARKAPHAVGWANISGPGATALGTAIEIRLAKPDTIAGRVVSEDGEPVAGASVTIPILMRGNARESRVLFQAEGCELPTAVSGEDGRFVLEGVPDGCRAALRVRAEGCGETLIPGPQIQPTTDLVEAGSEDVEIILPPESVIAGVVRRKAGGPPVAGATVKVTRAFFLQSQSTRTGPDGRFEFRGMSATTPVGLTAALTGRDNATSAPIQVTLKPGETKTDVELVLHAETSAVIRVVTESGAPIADASLHLMNAGRGHHKQMRTDAAGVARTALVPGEWRIASLQFRGGWHRPEGTVTVEAGTNTEHRIVIPGFEECAGIVMDPDGTPLAGALVSTIPAYNTTPVTSSDDGRFRLTWYVRPNSNRRPKLLLVRHAERNLVGTSPVPADDAPAEMQTVVGVTATGTVALPDGVTARVTGLRVNVRLQNIQTAVPGPPISVEETGAFTIPALPTNAHITLYIRPPDGVAPGNQTVGRHPSGQTVDLGRIALARANLTLTGTVETSEGDPLAQVRIQSQGRGQPSRSTTTDETGAFKLDGLAAGPVTVNAYIQQGRHRSQRLETEAGATDVKIVFPALPKITGTVRDAAGEPVQGAKVQVNPYGHGLEAETGAEGAFEVRWQNQHARSNTALLVTARHEEQGLAGGTEVSPTGRQPVEITVRPTVGLTGRVVDGEGAPVPQARVMVSLVGKSWSTSYGRSGAVTDAEGAVTLTGLPRGLSLRLQCNREGYGQVTRELTVPDDNEATPAELPPFILQRADRTLAGVVVDADGEPVANARVQARGDGQPSRQVQSGKDGSFKLEGLCRGEIQLSCYYNTGAVHANTRMTWEEEGDDGAVRIVLDGLHTAAGRIVNADGEPVAGARVTLPPAVDAHVDIRTDAEGHFRIRWSRRRFGNRRPELFLVAREESSGLAAVTPWEDNVGDEDTERTITVRPGATLSGRVTGPDGEGVEGVRLWVSSEAGTAIARDERSDVAGNYTIRAIPADTAVRLRTRASAFGPGEIRLQTPPTAGAPRDVSVDPIVLEPANLTVTGVVVDETDTPVARANVNFSGSGQPSQSARTDTEGRFTIAHACPGAARIHASAHRPTHRYASLEVQGGDQGLRIVIKPPDGYTPYAAPAIPIPKLGEDFDPDSAFYWCDFDKGAERPEWSAQTRLDLTVNGEDRTVLGQFAAEPLSLWLEDLPAHTHVRVYLELYILGSWDGNRISSGPDVMDIRMDGGPRLLFNSLTTQSRAQSHPFPFRLGQARGGAGAVPFELELLFGRHTWSRHACLPMLFTVPHDSDTLGLFLMAIGPRGPEDETWALDNVGIELLAEAPPADNVSEEALAAAWTALGQKEPPQAWKAMDTFRRAGDAGVAFLLEKTGWAYDAELHAGILELCEAFEFDDPYMWEEAAQACAELPNQAWPLVLYCLDMRRFGPEPPVFLQEDFGLKNWKEAQDAAALREGRAAFLLEQAWTRASRQALLFETP